MNEPNINLAGNRALPTQPLATLRSLLPGIVLCSMLYLAAGFVQEHYGGAIILTALLMGMAFNNLSQDARYGPGIDFCARRLLRVGIALLGLQVHMDQLREVQWQPVILVLTSVPLTLLFSQLLGKALQLSRWESLLAGGAVAICGVSAVLALLAVLPRERLQERFTLCILVSVTSLSTLVMVLYPALLTRFSSDMAFQGLFLGATIHDVAQVAAAGYLISEPVGELATFTKMLRVAMLVPLILLLNLLLRPGKSSAALPVPFFLLAFMLLILVGNLGWISSTLQTIAADISRLCLIMTVAALGTKTVLSELFQTGWKPLTLMTGNTLFLALLAATLLLLMNGMTQT